MLLPSDVARLVLGYLQEEGLSATSQAFIHESPNLKEYAEHTIGDGAVPACVFSIFGKGLTSILNEYMAAKTKETCHEVPAVMTSLWKKLDFTLKQIKSLQNSPATSACQRARSRVGMANLARQRALTVTSAGSVVCSSVTETSSVLSHSTPVSDRAVPGSGTHLQIQDVSRSLRDSPLQIPVSELRSNLGPMSPGRRKWDTPRKRCSALTVSSSAGKPAVTVSNSTVEPQTEEVVNENFPQLVIQNARDKILGDRSLQEKLAENINKILANEPAPQTSKPPSSTLEADQSIDEILGLQGEIHMSDDAIHDILEQTESDPAFQALFDLFDYNKTRLNDGEQLDGDVSGSPEESDTAGATTIVENFQHEDLGLKPESSPTTAKTKAIQERKMRKATTTTLLKKTILCSSGRASRIENSSANLIVNHWEQRGFSSAPDGSSRKENSLIFTDAVGETPMDIDRLLDTPPPTSHTTETLGGQGPVAKDSFTASTANCESASALLSVAPATPVTQLVSNVDRKKENTQGFKELPFAVLSNQLALVSPVESSTDLPSTSSSGGANKPVLSPSATTESVSSILTSSDTLAATAKAAVAVMSSSNTPNTTPCGSSYSSLAAAPTALTGTSTSSPTTIPLCDPSVTTSDSAASNHNTPSKAAAELSNIVSLKIIISENQDEDSPNNTASHQENSGMSMDRVPTIFLSPPVKPSGSTCLPRANLDEAALAVSDLQSSEAQANPFSGVAGPASGPTFVGTSQAPQSYIIQLPLETANPTLQGASASYLLVTETPGANSETKQMFLPAGVSKGQPLSTNSQYSVTTATQSQAFPAGSAFLLPSPVKPMMLPMSVMGQNTLGKVQMVTNQLVSLPNPVPRQQSETARPKPPTNAVQPSTSCGKLQSFKETARPKPPTKAVQPSTSCGAVHNLVRNVMKPLPTENTGPQNVEDPSSNHRRILRFDNSADVQETISESARSAIPQAASTLPPQYTSGTESENAKMTSRTKPTILSGNKPKRRIETTVCSPDPQTGVRLGKKTEGSLPLQQQQKDVKKNPRKQDHKVHNQELQSASTTRVDAFQSAPLKNSPSRSRSKSSDKGRHEAKTTDFHSSRSLSCDSELRSASKKDESSRREPTEKGSGKLREGLTEKRPSTQNTSNVIANKENEMKGSLQEHQQQSTSSSSTGRDFSSPSSSDPVLNSQPKATKGSPKTSSLAKQAVELLQDIQGLNSNAKSVKRPIMGNSESINPQTPSSGCSQEPVDCPRTPSCQKKVMDGEGTPKHTLPPNTPDVPTCSPASEAGSENSVSMAAHTLMILSRAAIARTGTPLKNSLRQDGVGKKSPPSSKKRKLASPITSPPAKKESKQSSNKKKDKEKKKLENCFPHDLDVDKFLSSLHYDE